MLRPAQDAGCIELRDAFLEGVIDDLEIGFGMSCRQEAGETVLDVNPAQAQVIEQQGRERVLVVNVEEEPTRERLDFRRDTVAGKQGVQVGGESCGAR